MEIKLPKIAKEGHSFILIFAVVTLVLFIISSSLGLIGLALTVWCITFFRDPERVTPQHQDLVIAPADGKIIKIEKTYAPKELELEGEMLKISIFMNVFNVHVNRSPCPGKISKIMYHPGKFINASLDKASVDNERQGFVLDCNNGNKIAFVQIAGLVARRIVSFVDEGTIIKGGEKFGLIKFGSRVDVYLPSEVTPFVSVGQTTIAGETILADFSYKGAELPYETLDRAK
jgi:phosphatidylserine decarboxylase